MLKNFDFEKQWDLTTPTMRNIENLAMRLYERKFQDACFILHL